MSFVVVIPAFNDESAVADAITSALAQPGVDEVVVVDDGSTDRTAARAEAVAGPVRCISQRNAGPAAARNRGASAASARFVVFLDSDDQLAEGAIQHFAAGHAQGTLLVRAASSASTEGNESVRTLPEPSPHPFPRGTPLAGSFSVDRLLFQDIGGYDEAFRFGENSELLMRLTMALDSSRIAFLADPTVHVRPRVGRSSTHYDKVRLAAVERMLEIHRAELEADPETLRAHLLIASNIHRREHRRVAAVRYAASAARVGTPSMRSLYRIARAALPPPS